jgi:hypothetical protein
MGAQKDWVPAREEKLMELMALWREKLADPALQTACEWPEEECTRTLAALIACADARAAYQAAPTNANHTQKEELKQAAVEEMRKFARERIRYNRKMSDARKQEMGIRIPGLALASAAAPDTGPDSEAIISAREPGVVKVRYLGAKPYGVDWLEIAWALSGTVIDSPDQLSNKDVFSRNPWEHTFPGADRGKKLYYSLCYLTKAGPSHWSEVREVIIP